MNPSILRSFYTCTVESILTGCITAWFGNSTAGNRSARVVRTARHIVGGEPPSRISTPGGCIRKARRITNDSSTRPTDFSLCCPQEERLRSSRIAVNEQSELIHPTAHSHCYDIATHCTLRLRLFLFVTYTIYREYIISSEMYSLHLNPILSEHTPGAVGSHVTVPGGAVGGSVPCSRTPQSWY